MLDRLIARTDHLRFPALPGTSDAWRKEWYHFCVLGEEVDAIINLNLSGDTRPAAPAGSRLARAIVLVREAGGPWTGDVDSIPSRDVAARPGGIDLAFGHNTVAFDSGAFHISAALAARPVALALTLRPETVPLLLRDDARVAQGTIGWLVVPRLVAEGTVTVGGRAHPMAGALAYHDHNWGNWLWGDDFAWEWGFALPDDPASPWSVVFDRTTNRSRTRVLELTVALWRGERLHRLFTRRDVRVRRAGHLAAGRLPKFPPVMALVAPERTTDVPEVLEVEALAGGDRLGLRFRTGEAAQVVIPNETDLGATIINEVAGSVEVSGRVKGEDVNLRGRGVFEFVTP